MLRILSAESFSSSKLVSHQVVWKKIKIQKYVRKHKGAENFARQISYVWTTSYPLTFPPICLPLNKCKNITLCSTLYVIHKLILQMLYMLYYTCFLNFPKPVLCYGNISCKNRICRKSSLLLNKNSLTSLLISPIHTNGLDLFFPTANFAWSLWELNSTLPPCISTWM